MWFRHILPNLFHNSESPASSTMAGDSTLSNPPTVSVSRTQYILNATFAAVIMSLVYYQLYVFRSMIYEALRLVFGTLYPAYASYKAVRTKNVKEYVKWMMYWIVFALFTCAETFTDVFLSFWFPFYYEIKIILVLWLLSPATKGSSILYRKFVHPTLSRREQEIDEYIARAKEQGYHTVLHLGSKGVNYATTVIMQTAIKTLPLSVPLLSAVSSECIVPQEPIPSSTKISDPSLGGTAATVESEEETTALFSKGGGFSDDDEETVSMEVSERPRRRLTRSMITKK